MNDSLLQFAKDPSVRIAISNQSDGSMKKETGEINHANLLKFYKKSQFAGMSICMQQVHGNNVTEVQNYRDLVIGYNDGLLTNKKNIALAVMTADCLPILLYDPVVRSVAAIHAGRRGIVKNIIQIAIEKMKKIYGTNPIDLYAFLGPAIRRDCYEVGAEVVGEFESVLDDSTQYVKIDAGKYFLSLKKAARMQLTKAGVKKENITSSPVCTKCDANYYSYRRGDTTGRFVTLIGLT